MRLEHFRIGVLAAALISAGVAHSLRADEPLDDGLITAAAREHWAFRRPVRPALPVIQRREGVRHPIDRFVAAGHERLGLSPAPEADRRTLIFRLSLDLVGLPPTPEEVDAFVGDREPDAWSRLVERVLSSPHYGERWGRHWLDLVRWAESDGYEANELRRHAWRYRDYVVKSFNADLPYDRFLREQLAGDEIEPFADERLIATGFLAATRTNNNEEDKRVQLNEPLVDITNTVATVTLGLTLGCAQCHDHKFEPLSERDYYALHGYFVRGQTRSLLLTDEGQIRQWEAQRPAELDEAKKSRSALYDPVFERLRNEAREQLSSEQRAALDAAPEARTPEQIELAREAEKKLAIGMNKVQQALDEMDRKRFDELDKKVAALEKEYQEKRPQTWGFHAAATSPHRIDFLPPRGQFPFPDDPKALAVKQPVVLKRGSVHRPGDAVNPAVPAILRASATSISAAGEKSGDGFPTRSSLADWLAGDENPLTARVWVNYIWQQHFGRGLVATAGDFGLRGERPTHPELLDWLAVELRESGWSTRHIHRLIVTSDAYRQAAGPIDANAKIDPDNRFLWHWVPRRLESEALRDRLLAVSGQLNGALGGPSDDDPAKSDRSSIYLQRKRYQFSADQSLFDAPTANESCTGRHVSTVPLQPLYLLNNAEVFRRARAFAARVHALARSDTEKQTLAAFRLAFSRAPDPVEAAAAREFFQKEASQGPENGDGPPMALIHFCHALVNLNEFVYLE